jgi:hypothetical protein
MPSEVSIVNGALARLGDDVILSLSDDSKRARLANLLYADVRDTVLRAHPWNFATARAQLGQLVAMPAFGYTHQYQLPSDPYCLRVLEMDNPGYTFKIEGRVLLTDEDPCYIRYIARITDPAQFDATFTEALSARLAAEMAYALTGHASLAEAMWKLYELKLREARGMDGLEGTTDPFVSDDLLEVR